MQIFCSIISPDFVPFVQCLYSSIARFDSEIELHVLVTSETLTVKHVNNKIKFCSLNEIDSPFLKEIEKKYAGINDYMRWSLKPVFLLHLLNYFERVVYVDCDLFFFNDYSFLFNELETKSILLTPHFGSTDPFQHEEKFMMNFLIGLYNAGFVGASKKGIKTLQWWAAACFYHTENAPSKGYFVDQRYLDMVPVFDENAGIVRHQGCNIGSWNIETYKRNMQVNGTVVINNQYPIIFVHFNHETIKHILNGNDKALQPYYSEYEKTFSSIGHELKDFIPMLEAWKKKGWLLKIKRRLSVRTHIKRMLFNLAKKL